MAKPKVSVHTVHNSGPSPSATKGTLSLPSSESVTIRAGELMRVPTNVIVDVPDGWVGFALTRSELYKSYKVFCPTGIELVFPGHVGAICVSLLNTSMVKGTTIPAGETLAHLIFVKTDSLDVELVH